MFFVLSLHESTNEKVVSTISGFIKRIILLAGLVFLISLALSFTTVPFHVYHWLGTSRAGIEEEPDYIVMMGGSGMPSESNLMRAWYVARAARTFPNSKIIISIPGNLTDSLSTPHKIAHELTEKGISPDRIRYEQHGTNTRSQTLNLRLFHGQLLVRKPMLVVTSPEHMRRAILSFQKAGFTSVSGLPAFENNLEADLSFEDKKLGGNKLAIPPIGHNQNIRYQFWNHLKYEILIARELAAITYYWLRGWI